MLGDPCTDVSDLLYAVDLPILRSAFSLTRSMLLLARAHHGANARPRRVEQAILGLAVQAILCLATLASLVACGGGGSSSAPMPPIPPPAPTNSAPVASFSADPGDQVAPVPVQFDASASSDADGRITSFDWDFGDGTQGNGQQTTHTYTTAGDFTARLTVIDDAGASNSSVQSIGITAPAPGTAVLRGQIQILASSAIDADVNDVLSEPNQSNNSANNAQPVPVPVSLGGFANLPGTGVPTGRLFNSGDPSDFYAFNGAGGERIALDVGDHPNADLDLRLWNSDLELVDASVGSNATESLSVPGPGDYFVEVSATSGASAYVLGIGLNSRLQADPSGRAESAASQHRRATRLSDAFVPGEFLLRHSAAQLAPAAQSTTNAMANTEQIARAGDVTLYRLTDMGGAIKQLGAGAGSGKGATNEQALRYATLRKVAALQREGLVTAEPNLLRYPHRTPNDPLFGAQWHFDNINLPLAWDLTLGERNVIVAVVDTGVLINHPDFSGQLVPGFDFISSPLRAGDGDGIDSNPDDPGDASIAGSSSFHGTHVAAIAGGLTDNATGIASAGWNTRVMPLRALGRDGGSSFDILQAIRYAAGLPNNSGTTPGQRADIINLSLGGGLFSQSEQDLFNELAAAGLLVFASAGNESSGNPDFPASYDGVIAVSATTITNELASYSNFGSAIDLAAPGGDSSTDLNGDGVGDGVMSALGNDSTGNIDFTYGVLSGTSMAAPHAAGVAALMKAVHPALTPDEFNLALAAGVLTQDLGPAGRDDEFGHGLIDAQQAVLAAIELANGTAADPGPILSISATRLNFGTFQTEFIVTVRNAGTQELIISGINSTQPWLSATPASIDAQGVGTYALRVDRSGLDNATYRGTVTFASNSNSRSVDVLMQVSELDLQANAGTHFVILVDAESRTVAQTLVNTPTSGTYRFGLTDVLPGDYRLFAGTDLDNDDLLCDAGEACGAFRTLDAPEQFSVSESRLDLDFLSGFRQNFNASARGATEADPETETDTETETETETETDKRSLRVNKAKLIHEKSSSL